MSIKIRVKKPLKEITRYEKETGRKYNIVDEFTKRITVQPCEYAFTMTKILKIGINPKTKYNTPAGVYCYPLDSIRYTELIENELPFMSDAPYVGLVKLNWNAKWLTFGKDNGTPEDEESVAAYLKYKYDFDINDFSERPLHWNHSPNARIFDMTYFCSLAQAKDTGTRPTIMWTQILKELGYDGVYDEGAGIIHSAERTQLVCLTLNAYEKVGMYETAALRALSGPVQKKGRYKRNAAIAQAEARKFWKDFATLPPEKKIIREETFNINNHVAKHGEKFLDTLQDAKFTGNVVLALKDSSDGTNIDRIPKNIKVFGIFVLYLYPADDPVIADNVDVNELKLSDAKYLPQGIEFTNLNLTNNYSYIQLPDNLVIPGDLRADRFLRALPNNIKISGELRMDNIKEPGIFFPANFDFKFFTGRILGTPFQYATKDEVVHFLKTYSAEPITESVKKKILIRLNR